MMTELNPFKPLIPFIYLRSEKKKNTENNCNSVSFGSRKQHLCCHAVSVTLV